MRALSLLCKSLGWVWLVLAGLFLMFVIISVWVEDGFAAVRELLSPFNVLYYVIALARLAPGLLLLGLAEKFDKKKACRS